MTSGPSLLELIISHGLSNGLIVKQPPGGVGEFTAWCPWHDDRRQGGKPSLGINNKSSRGVVKCMSSRCGKGGIRALAEEWGVVQKKTDSPTSKFEIETSYDYQKPDGSLLFQVVRLKTSPGAKKEMLQRKPDPDKAGQWIWSVKGVRTVLYRLPELRAADPDDWVFVVEGERDVDTVVKHGLVATTNPMGAGKWNKTYTNELKGRKLAVPRDNDEAGRFHQALVCNENHATAQVVKLIDLPDLPEDGGDISDWFEAGHTVDELMEIVNSTPAYEPPPVELRVTVEPGRTEWKIAPRWDDLVLLTSRLTDHGSFVNGDAETWFFNRDNRQLITLDEDNIDLKVMLADSYKINAKDPLYGPLVAHLQVEAYARGQQAIVRKLSYYAREENAVLLDMGKGNVLKITPDNIEIRENGEDGILFRVMQDHDPWEYRADAPANILFRQMIEPVNFSDEGTYTVEQQQLLLLLWIISFSFESLMKTRPITLAVGPPESGKSSLFRYIGQLLLGAEFDVDSPGQDQKAEEQFWANVTNSLFVCYDDVNTNIRWLADALARVATGSRLSKRTLHTTNQLSRFPVRCMLALTAMTPGYALRTGFVASRAIIFTMKQLEFKREEFEIEAEIRANRNELMSDYAKMVQKALQVPLDDVVVADRGIRLADFQRVATRIGIGLGVEEDTHNLFRAIRDSQAVFATEEDPIAVCLALWIDRHAPSPEGDQAEMLEPIPNNGRRVLTRLLMIELKKIAAQNTITIFADTPDALGKKLGILQQALSRTYDIDSRKSGRTREGKGSWWQFTLKQDPLSEDTLEDLDDEV